MKKVIAFMKLGIKLKLLLLFSYILTGVFRLMILRISFRKLALWMGNEKEVSSYSLHPSHISKLEKIKWAIEIVSRYTPWESLCMVQALTGQTLLKIFNIQSTIYLGLSKDEDSKLLAHAWLRCGNRIVTGEDTMAQFKAVNWYTSKVS